MSADHYRQLIEQLETAVAPDRGLDSAIGRALETLPTEPFKTKAPFERIQGMYYVIGKRDTSGGPVDEKWARCPPLYTFSVDAAVTLVPPHHLWQVKQGIEASAVVWMLETDYDERDPPMGYSTTFPAIALCIAALRARAERETRTESAPAEPAP